MTSSLVITIGLVFLLISAIASALFRTSNASLLSKIVAPTLLVILSCALWYVIPSILGFPLETAFASLPQQAELIAFVPHDEEHTVCLWLREGDGNPRSYLVPLTDDLKKTLQEAKQAQSKGERTELKKGGGKKRPAGYIDIDGGAAPYELLPNAFQLPEKK